MIATVGLELGTLPGAGDKWRVVVRDTGVRKDGAALGERWYNGTGSGFAGNFGDNGLATLQLGFPASQPVPSGAYFVMDVKFSTLSPPALPLSTLALKWTDRLGGEVVRVKKVAAGESSSAGATDRSQQLALAIEEAPKGLLEQLGDAGEGAARAGKTAADTLQLLFWAVIIGGVVYLVSKSQTFRG